MKFSEEQIEKAKQCKTIEELKKLAKEEGLNLTDAEAESYFDSTRVGLLTDEELDIISGGKGGDPQDKPKYAVNERVERVAPSKVCARRPRNQLHGVVLRVWSQGGGWEYDVMCDDGPTRWFHEWELRKE